MKIEMDFDKLLSFASEYVSDYFSVFIETLRDPALRFSPSSEDDNQANAIILGKQNRTSPRLSPRLFSFLLISIFLGTTLNALLPNRKSALDFISYALILSASWFLYSLVIHFVCIAGSPVARPYEITLSVSFQVFSVMYVVSNCVALLFAVIVNIPQVHSLAISTGGRVAWLAANPAAVFFAVNFYLWAVYLPIALRKVHGYSKIYQLNITTLTPLWALIAFSIYLMFGVMLIDIR